MATSKPSQAEPAEPEQPAAEEPRTLDVKPCDVCRRNTVDGTCSHCGFGLTGTREAA